MIDIFYQTQFTTLIMSTIRSLSINIIVIMSVGNTPSIHIVHAVLNNVLHFTLTILICIFICISIHICIYLCVCVCVFCVDSFFCYCSTFLCLRHVSSASCAPIGQRGRVCDVITAHDRLHRLLPRYDYYPLTEVAHNAHYFFIE